METVNIGKYLIYVTEKIGQGQQGIILKCTNTETNEQLCVKVIEGLQLGQFLSRENDILKTIKSNPCCNVLKIYDILSENNRVFVFMELCPYDLEGLIEIRANYWFSSEEIFNLLGQIVNGYQHLRKFNIIHRDLKPSNLLITELQDKKILVKIADFGVGKLQNRESAVTKAGTPFYQAPEVGLNNELSSYNDQCDIYSLGIILYKLCFRGQLHIQISTMNQLLEYYRQLSHSAFQCPRLAVDVDEYLIVLIEKMIVYDPSKRVTWDQLSIIPQLQLQFILLEDKYFVDFSKTLGSGMQGVTYLTSGLKTNEKYCTKVINHHEQEGQREREIYQKMIMQGQQNQNVIAIYDIIQEGLQTYLVMEKCDENIEQYYLKKKKLTDQEILDILKQIVNGYCYLKNLDIIHRDLKPQNILIKYINQQPVIKIIDFGVGKIISKFNVASTIAGTPVYSAPEVLEGASYDYQCDIYSLGAMLYQLIYGKLYINPISIEHLQELLNEFRIQPFKCPNSGNPQLEKLIESMLQFYPENRITWDQLKQHPLISQMNPKIKILSKQITANSGAQDQFQQIPVSFSNDIVPNQQDILVPQPSDNVQQPSSVMGKIKILSKQSINSQYPNQQVNEHNETATPGDIVEAVYKFNLQARLKGEMFVSLFYKQGQQIHIAQYIYYLMLLSSKVIDHIEQGNENDIVKGLKILIFEFISQGLKDLQVLEKKRQIYVDTLGYLFSKEFQSFLNQQEVEYIIKQITQQQQDIDIGLFSKEVRMYLQPLLFTLKAKIKEITLYDVLALYQEFYYRYRNIIQQQQYSLKTQFYLEKLYQIKRELPITSHQNYSEDSVIVKIFTEEIAKKYLRDKLELQK